jgi:hypothetical protein
MRWMKKMVKKAGWVKIEYDEIHEVKPEKGER